MKSWKIKIFIGVLILFTAAAAGLHLLTRESIPEHQLLINIRGNDSYVDIDKLEFETVTGIRVNGKGEEIPVEAPGISLQDVLVHAGVEHFENAVIESDDSYRAEVSQAEIREEGKVYLLEDEDESLRLIVFGDKDSKRSVSHVVKLIVE